MGPGNRALNGADRRGSSRCPYSYYSRGKDRLILENILGNHSRDYLLFYYCQYHTPLVNRNMRTFNIHNITVSNNEKFFLIAGPCQIESHEHALKTANAIKIVCDSLGIKFVYKSSFDKANRSSIKTKRGLGIEEGLEILNTVKHTLGVPILTDIHETWQADLVAEAGPSRKPICCEPASRRVSGTSIGTGTTPACRQP